MSRGARIGLVAAALAASVGCSPSADQRFIPYPGGAAGHASMLLGVFDGDTLLRIQAHELDEGLSTIRLSEDGSEGSNVRLEALLHQRTLAELGLEAGVIEEANASSHYRTLAPAEANFELSLSEADDWTQTASPSARLAEIHVRLDCGLAAVRSINVPSPRDAVVIQPLADGRLLVGTEEPKLFVIDGEQVDEVEVVGGGQPCANASMVGSGELWFGGCGGGIYRGRMDGNQLVLTLVAWTAERVHSFAGRVDPATQRAEMIILGYYFGTVQYFDGISMSTVHTLDRSTSDNRELGGVAWVGPGEGIAVVESTTEIVHLRNGQLEIETSPSGAGFASATYSPGLGALLGTVNGELYVDRDGAGRWEAIEGFSLGRWLAAMTPLQPGGLVFGTAFGSAGYYLPDLGVCGPAQTTAFNINLVTRYGTYFVFAGDNPNVDETPITLVELR